MGPKESNRWCWREVKKPLGFVVFRDSNPPDTPMPDDDVNPICHCQFAPDAQRIAGALAAYEQLCAEVDQLRFDAELAEGVIAEDNAELVSLRLECNDLRAENARLRLTLESEPLAAVMTLANRHYCEGTWRDQPDARWLAGMVEEVGELASALEGRHEHEPDMELRQIASIALNWLARRRVRV